MKRFDGLRHYLHSLAQSEPATATKTLCRTVVCSHGLVIDGWGALLGELCSLPVSYLCSDAHSSHHPNSIHIQRAAEGASYLERRRSST